MVVEAAGPTALMRPPVTITTAFIMTLPVSTSTTLPPTSAITSVLTSWSTMILPSRASATPAVASGISVAAVAIAAIIHRR